MYIMHETNYGFIFLDLTKLRNSSMMLLKDFFQPGLSSMSWTVSYMKQRWPNHIYENDGRTS